MDQIIATARALLQSSQEEKAVELLAPEIDKNQDCVPLLEIYGETLLEVNDVETAYNVFMKAVELDPEAAQGVQKFLYLGQIIGGQDGIQYINVGLNKLQDQLEKVQQNAGDDDLVLVELAKVYTTGDALAAHLIKKMNQGLFAEIEMWMTDLCMEPEAEEQCDRLIALSLAMDDRNPEALSLLALIRISQQRDEEAKEALLKSWEIFQERKEALEVQQNQDGEDSSLEYVELVQPLLQLARFAIELAMYDVAPQITAGVADINDNALDCFYYEGLAHLMGARQIIGGANTEEDYREIPVKTLKKSDDEAVKSLLADARSSLTQGYRVVNSGDAEAMYPELAEQVNELLTELGGPNMAELMPSRKDEEEEEGWEEELDSE